jgi:hypothetical protein
VAILLVREYVSINAADRTARADAGRHLGRKAIVMRLVETLWRSALCGVVALLPTTGFAGVAAAADTEQVLYSFCSQSNCSDGANPTATLITDKAGNLYGTSQTGGNNRGQCQNDGFNGINGCGVVFELTPKPGGGWTETVLYAFCSQSNCTDGFDVPNGKLIMDAAGNLYGTTESGGANNSANECGGLGCGVVFELTPTQSGGWTYSVIYNFCSQTNCADGYEGGGGLIMDGSGNLYGTALGGSGRGATGATGVGSGVVFELTPRSGGGWTETVLYNFCSQTNCADGQTPFPNDGLIMDGSGNLYGTTAFGGNGSSSGLLGSGVVFELTPRSGGGWTETVLYNFCSQSNCADGADPQASLTMDAKGNLFGTAPGGGNGSPSGSGSGVVFELKPKVGGGWTEMVLYNFCSQGGANCTDGEIPGGALLMDAAGDLYGTTPAGGNPNTCLEFTPSGCGVVFELAPNQSGGWTETTLYTFCSQTNCADGGNPQSALIMDGSGNLYGANDVGGNSNSAGVVFELIPPASNTIATLTVSETGNGLVLSSPIGISCPSTCSATFAPGTQVSLTAEPANGFAFTGWGGACSGVGTCTVTMNAAQSVSANFAQTTPPSSPLVAAVLPSSRSVELGNTATAFATIINAGTTTAPGCSITPVTALPIDFLYQTTNPTTNALAGTANTPTDILAGQFQSFVIALTPTAAFNPTNIPFSFACNNVAQAPSQTGLNTLLLSASGTPVPDIVALAATPKGDGILHIPGPTGSAAFAVATVNLGASATITATANTGSTTLPVTLTICQTNPQTGQCLVLPPTPSVTTTINADATPTFSIFATASGSVPFLPAVNRIFVQFSDSGSVVRGSTSVAVTNTQ